MQHILPSFGLDPAKYSLEPFGSGLINHTWKVSDGNDRYILQRINKNVFKQPRDISENLATLDAYLKSTAPDYLFAAPLPAADGKHFAEADGEFYRLQPFVKNSKTVNAITQTKQAFEAARQFGKFSRLLNSFDAGQLKCTLPDFHNLGLRVRQFQSALIRAGEEKFNQAETTIRAIEDHIAIAETYQELLNNEQMPVRVIHHDTKINNVLFNDNDEGLCVIDLDTVMPGYFISDVGDMMRTYLSPANEEEQDLEKVQINIDYFKAVYIGYVQEMGDVLTTFEKSLFIYAGKFMIYMQAVRFLTDFLNGDVYYPTQYPGHNLARAQNQLVLLDRYGQLEDTFTEIIAGA